MVPRTTRSCSRYEGAGVNDNTRLQLFANWQGSITTIMKGDESGEMVAINGYDEYGIANETNIGRFSYTGQITLPELGLYHYKARVYSPTLGRFLQTDPIGYEDQVNLYAYVGNDPVNLIDPSGERNVTVGERLLLEGTFGTSLTEIINTEIISNPFSSRGASIAGVITAPHRLYEDDYSKVNNKTLRNFFWHEFYHRFEQLLGIKTTRQMVGETIQNFVNGTQGSTYSFDPQKGFWGNHFEARAEYFAKCVEGGDCTSLEKSNFKVNNNVTLKFKNGKFYTEERRGRIILKRDIKIEDGPRQ